MLKFLILLPFNLGLWLFSLLFSWLIALFVRWDATLPKYLFWFSTTDALMNGKGTKPNGGGGDKGFYERHLNDSVWWTTVCWLWRNPTNGFDETVCKGKVDGDVKCIGDRHMETKDRFLFRLSHMGWRSLFDKPFEIYLKWRYSKPLMMRVRLGWKLSEFIENPGKHGIAQYVVVPNPFKRNN